MDEIVRNTDQPAQFIERANGAKEICGYASVYYDGTPNTEYQLEDDMVERIKQGAFDHALAQRQNVQIRYNHSPDWVLGDVETGAVVKSDDKGLSYSLPYDANDPQHNTVRSKLEKKLIRGSSFAASGPKYQFEKQGETTIAWLTSVNKLVDCAPVCNPAYKGAPALLRSDELKQQYNDWLKAHLETQKRSNRYAK